MRQSGCRSTAYAASLAPIPDTVLQMFFDTDNIRFGVTSRAVGFPPGETRYFNRFSEPLDEITEARIWAGLHFRTADVQGRRLGRKVAHYMAKHYFQPLGSKHHFQPLD